MNTQTAAKQIKELSDTLDCTECEIAHILYEEKIININQLEEIQQILEYQ